MNLFSRSLTVVVLVLCCLQLVEGAAQLELTFNIKEVRAFLVYCESLQDCDAYLRMIDNGAPILLETQSRHTVYGEEGSQVDPQAPLHMQLVVATLAVEAAGAAPSQQAQSTPYQAGTPSQLIESSPSFRQKQSAPMMDVHISEQADDASVPMTPPQ